ncbi:MAG TPA: DUF805 domain-containing protein [Pseudorhodoplanes sp.]|nr:DUF805 domain-containing protein [Pseudorhodoplanes sp.]
MTAENQPQPEAKPLDLFLSFKGRIGRGQFAAGLGAMIALAFVMMFAAAGFMDSRGGFGLFIPVTIVLLLLIAWIHSAVVVKRLRDAGIPGWCWFIFGPGPFVLLLLAAEYLKAFWWVAVLAALAIFVAPAFFPSKPPEGQ